MARRLGFLGLALVLMLGWEVPDRVSAFSGCADPNFGFADVDEWCNETATLLCDEGTPTECRPGTICDSPDTSGLCDNDNAQCRCTIHTKR